jgi:type II secretory pathway predicted ATPase ExeA
LPTVKQIVTIKCICLSPISVGEFYKEFCFQLGLEPKGGEPVLNRTLERPIHEALKQRITIHFTFKGLNPDETKAYILHKIRLSGGSESIMGEDAIIAAAGYCKGNPRIIDNLMTAALKADTQLDKRTIDSETIMIATNELALG